MIEERILKLLSHFFSAEDVTLESRIVSDLDADSLDTIEIIMDIEEEFDIEISDESAEQLTTANSTVKELVDYVTAHAPT
jgi:acyl carrier protein